MLEGSNPTPARQIDPTLIKQRIKEARRKAKLTERDLAQRIGVTERTILRWENEEPGPDNTMPKISEAAKLLLALPITLDWLVGIEMEPSDVVRTVAARVGDEVGAMTRMLDLLLKELTDARAALQPSAVGLDEAKLNIVPGAGGTGEERAK
jgi:transcriptional regulator with XRE-family HTH domain